ncbi:hypothetical protein DVW12_16475 [Clostridium botulinum]|nr:hypothetical protein [Clostridium botulinum]
MYKPFFNNNILAYIEFLILLGFFIFLLYENFSKINIFYMDKFSQKIKTAILIITIPFHTLIYIILDKEFNINWAIGVVINAFMLTLILYLSIAVFFSKK